MSGLRIGGLEPSVWVERMNTLASLVASIGQCWVCGPTVAALHQWDGFILEPPFHIVVQRGRAIHRMHHFIHTSSWLPGIHRETLLGLPVMSPTRTLMDLAPQLGHDQLVRAVDCAFASGASSDDFLHRQLAEHRSRGHKGTERLLAAMEAVELIRGCESWLERTFLHLIAAAGLPRPLTQQVVGKRDAKLIRVDCRFPNTPVVIELLGYRYHRTEYQMRNDVERLNVMIRSGLAPTQFTYVHVREQPDYVIRTVADALVPYLP